LGDLVADVADHLAVGVKSATTTPDRGMAGVVAAGRRSGLPAGREAAGARDRRRSVLRELGTCAARLIGRAKPLDCMAPLRRTSPKNERSANTTTRINI